MKLYQKLASIIAAIDNCKRSDNTEWQQKHETTLNELMYHLPSGSGFDGRTRLSDTSTCEKIIFETAFHHMDEVGGYDGWTEHTVTVTGSLLSDFDIQISGRDRNDIKDYIGDCFHDALSTELED